MRFIHRQSILGLAVGVALVAATFAVQAHVAGASHAMPAAQDFLSISGSPAELADRSGRLAAHICVVIEAGTSCALPAIAETAAADLRKLQGGYAEGQQALHVALTSPTLDAKTWQAVEGEQLERLQAGSRRYLQFLVDTSSALSAEQKQRFAH